MRAHKQRVKALTSVVTGCERPESLLASSVPNLEFDNISLVLDRLQLEVDSDCVKEIFIERVLCVSQEQTGLAHPTVPNQQHFEQVVAVYKKVSFVDHLRFGSLRLCRGGLVFLVKLTSLHSMWPLWDSNYFLN